MRFHAALLRLAVLAIAACFLILSPVYTPAYSQTVISTHSGVLYFFEGSVFLGGERLEQKFGRFPDIGEGRELRTDQGRAEVLLTPGVFLRIREESSIRMISERLDDTRVALLSGAAILEANQPSPNTAVTLIYKQWEIRTRQQTVYRIDAEPAQLRVYRGEAEVSTPGNPDKVVVKEGENLPLAAVLVPDAAATSGADSFKTDSFKTWAMNRSQAVSADNAIASEIVDDPNQMDASGTALGLGLGAGLGGVSYFPQTGYPSLGIVNPYGVSFWSPYQSSLYSLYAPTYLYGGIYTGWPVIYPRTTLSPLRYGVGARPGLLAPRPPMTSPMRPMPSPVRAAPRPAIAPPARVGVHR